MNLNISLLREALMNLDVAFDALGKASNAVNRADNSREAERIESLRFAVAKSQGRIENELAGLERLEVEATKRVTP